MTDPRAIRGVGVSPGLAYAPAVLLEWNFPAVPDRWVTPEEVETEVNRLEEAVAAVVHSLNRLRERVLERAGADHVVETLIDIDTLLTARTLQARAAKPPEGPGFTFN